MYNHTHRTDTVSSALSRTSRRSDESYTSQLSALTAATSICGDDDEPSPLPPLTRHPQLRHISTRITHASTSSFRTSASPPASPRSSAAPLYAEPEEYSSYDDYPSSTPAYTLTPPPATAIPTTPHDFALYFPSHRRLTIAHDLSSPDLAQNLVITTAPDSGAKTPMQLFHLRMHDIPTRAFSLRRYCRDSGREVCHSVLRGAGEGGKKAGGVKQPKHPKLQRSMSTALATVTRAGVKRADSWGASSSHKASYPPPHLAPTPPLLTIPTRNDSGYETYFDDSSDFSTSDSEADEFDDEEEFAPIPAEKNGKAKGKKAKTNTTHLEFSNYAHVDLTRRGSRGKGKHWDFEYWGTLYSWKREGESYHLVPSSSSSSTSTSSGAAVAHIVPDVLTPSQTLEEAREGGWVPRCSFWISDAKMLQGGDVADVVVATGLMALVDDKARAEEGAGGRRVRRIKVPMSPVKLDLEVVGPREMMRSVFRRGSGDRGAGERPGTARRREESKLRFGRAVEAC